MMGAIILISWARWMRIMGIAVGRSLATLVLSGGFLVGWKMGMWVGYVVQCWDELISGFRSETVGYR
jgi:hypothetical protein